MTLNISALYNSYREFPETVQWQWNITNVGGQPAMIAHYIDIMVLSNYSFCMHLLFKFCGRPLAATVIAWHHVAS